MKVIEVLRLLMCAVFHKKHHTEEWGHFTVWIWCQRCKRVVQRTFLP